APHAPGILAPGGSRRPEFASDGDGDDVRSRSAARRDRNPLAPPRRVVHDGVPPSMGTPRLAGSSPRAQRSARSPVVIQSGFDPVRPAHSSATPVAPTTRLSPSIHYDSERPLSSRQAAG